ncbi:hypothetical protein ACJJIE_01650 [Microbulbifer sp. TRSA001]|uniref:hypothetical protein n=1 Tax=unclassified Microbulbifer TaxID=2619833 RepID=UPI0024AE54E2|nr:hypothetical protein [Microbulbifer sp. VAAF005]WHI46408.1 hypothetical protein P0078_22305 [Microbulbifer sp. VAAF005]
MKYQSIEQHLSSEFGYDQYQVSDHAVNHREEILRSEICGCFMCEENFPPSEIVRWTDNEQTACCPKCGLGSVVVGASSGMPVTNKTFLSLVGLHWS